MVINSFENGVSSPFNEREIELQALDGKSNSKRCVVAFVFLNLSAVG